MRGSAGTLACSPHGCVTGTDQRLTVPRTASPARARCYAASLPPIAITPSARPCRPRFTARRYSAFAVRAPSRYREVRRFGPVLRTVAVCPRSFPVSSGYRATATARRPGDGIAMPPSALRAIAPCSGIVPSRIVSRPAKRRCAPHSPALHSPSPGNALPCRLPLRRHPPMVSALPYSRLSSPRSRNRSLAASRSVLGRMADSGSLPATPASMPTSLTGHSTTKSKLRQKKVQPNRPDDRIGPSWTLQTTPIHVERTCHGAPTNCVHDEDRAMRPTCARRKHLMEKATLHTCAC